MFGFVSSFRYFAASACHPMSQPARSRVTPIRALDNMRPDRTFEIVGRVAHITSVVAEADVRASEAHGGVVLAGKNAGGAGDNNASSTILPAGTGRSDAPPVGLWARTDAAKPPCAMVRHRGATGKRSSRSRRAGTTIVCPCCGETVAQSARASKRPLAHATRWDGYGSRTLILGWPGLARPTPRTGGLRYAG